jgi:hypothetical protein
LCWDEPGWNWTWNRIGLNPFKKSFTLLPHGEILRILGDVRQARKGKARQGKASKQVGYGLLILADAYEMNYGFFSSSEPLFSLTDE